MKGRPATKIEMEAIGAICKLQDELYETQQVIRQTIAFLEKSAMQAEQIHDNQAKAYGEWAKSRKESKPVIFIALPIAAQAMLYVVKMLRKTLPKAKSEKEIA